MFLFVMWGSALHGGEERQQRHQPGSAAGRRRQARRPGEQAGRRPAAGGPSGPAPQDDGAHVRVVSIGPPVLLGRFNPQSR